MREHPTLVNPPASHSATRSPPSAWYPGSHVMVSDPPIVADVVLPVIAFGPTTAPFAIVNPSHVSNASNRIRYSTSWPWPTNPTTGAVSASGDDPTTSIRSRSPSWNNAPTPYSSSMISASRLGPADQSIGVPAGVDVSGSVCAIDGDRSSPEIPFPWHTGSPLSGFSSSPYPSRAVWTLRTNAAGATISPISRRADRKNSPSAVVVMGVSRWNDMAMYMFRVWSMVKKVGTSHWTAPPSSCAIHSTLSIVPVTWRGGSAEPGGGGGGEGGGGDGGGGEGGGGEGGGGEGGGTQETEPGAGSHPDEVQRVVPPGAPTRLNPDWQPRVSSSPTGASAWFVMGSAVMSPLARVNTPQVA